MNKTQIENAILKELYKCWIDESETSIDSLLLNLDGVSEKELSLVLDDLDEAGLIDNTSFGGFYSLTTNGVIQTEERNLTSDQVADENNKARSAIVQGAFEVRENEGRDADVNIDDVISEFELSESSALRNARLLDGLGWIEFRTARLYAITPYGRDRHREQIRGAESTTEKKKSQIFETMSNSYEVVGTLGHGGVGTVFEVRDADGKNFALKIISESVVSREKVRRFRNELQFLSRNNHPNLVSIIDHGFILRDDVKIPFYVMTKYGSTLRKLIADGIQHEKAVPYFEQLLSGVEFLHSKSTFHRDLKPENILYNAEADKLLIADLGAAHFSEDELHTLVETKPGNRLANFQYAAPEQRERGKVVTQLADLFALGAILNEMFTKSIPLGEEYPKISEVNADFVNLDSVVTKLMKHRPENRYQSIFEIRAELVHLGMFNGSTGNVPTAANNPLLPTAVYSESPKTAFQRSLEEIDRFRGEKAFEQQKKNYFNSQDGSDNSFAAFESLLLIAEERLSILKQKDASFQIETPSNRRAFVVKSSGSSFSFAIEPHYPPVELNSGCSINAGRECFR